MGRSEPVGSWVGVEEQWLGRGLSWHATLAHRRNEVENREPSPDTVKAIRSQVLRSLVQSGDWQHAGDEASSGWARSYSREGKGVAGLLREWKGT